MTHPSMGGPSAGRLRRTTRAPRPTGLSRRALLLAGAAVGVAACGRAAAPPTATPPPPATRAPASPPPVTEPTSTSPPAPTATTAPVAAARPARRDAATTVHAYVDALASDLERSRELLAPELRGAAGPGPCLAVARLAAQQVFRAELSVRTGGVPSPWHEGQNTRWFRLVEGPDGWRVAEIASSPIGAGEPGGGSYVRRGGRDLGLTFEVPAGWVQDPGEHVFRPAPGALAAVGVQRAAAGTDPRALLPNHSEVLSTRPRTLPWAAATAYTLRRTAPAAAEGVALGRRVHVVVAQGKALYDVFSTAPAGGGDRADAVREHQIASVALAGG
jgi:hypothetical protein